MAAPHFTLMIRDRIHECAPDHSIETITVGALRKAADEMAELYEALDLAEEQMSAARSELNRLRKVAKMQDREPAALNVAVYKAKTALAKAVSQ